METLIKNARLQFERFGFVRYTINFTIHREFMTNESSYQDYETKDLNSVINDIKDVFLGNNDDDIQVPHPNYF